MKKTVTVTVLVLTFFAMEFSAHGQDSFYDRIRKPNMDLSVDANYKSAIVFLTDKDPFRFNRFGESNQWEGKSLIDMALEGNDCVRLEREIRRNIFGLEKKGDKVDSVKLSKSIAYTYSLIADEFEKCINAINEYSNLTGEKKDLSKVIAASKYYDGKRKEWEAIYNGYKERINREEEERFKAKESELFGQ